MNVEGKDLLAEIVAQRNRALDEAANYAAQVTALRRHIAELMKQIPKNEDDSYTPPANGS